MTERTPHDRVAEHDRRVARRRAMPTTCPPAAVETARKLFLDVAGLVHRGAPRDYVAATLAAVDRGGPCTALRPCQAVVRRVRRRARQRHRRARRGLRRHVRGRSGALRRGHRSGGARRLRAGRARRRSAARRHRRPASSCCAGSAWWRRWRRTRPGSIRPPCSARSRRPARSARRCGCRRRRSRRRSASPAAWRPGIIEYLAEGTWTKRMHAGWAAQSGMRAALMARGGFRRTADGLRRRARRLSRVRAVGDARFRAARRRPRQHAG